MIKGNLNLTLKEADKNVGASQPSEEKVTDRKPEKKLRRSKRKKLKKTRKLKRGNLKKQRHSKKTPWQTPTTTKVVKINHVITDRV